MGRPAGLYLGTQRRLSLRLNKLSTSAPDNPRKRATQWRIPENVLAVGSLRIRFTWNLHTLQGFYLQSPQIGF